jgi:hypothetical protein
MGGSDVIRHVDVNAEETLVDSVVARGVGVGVGVSLPLSRKSTALDRPSAPYRPSVDGWASRGRSVDLERLDMRLCAGAEGRAGVMTAHGREREGATEGLKPYRPRSRAGMVGAGGAMRRAGTPVFGSTTATERVVGSAATHEVAAATPAKRGDGEMVTPPRMHPPSSPASSVRTFGGRRLRSPRKTTTTTADGAAATPTFKLTRPCGEVEGFPFPRMQPVLGTEGDAMQVDNDDDRACSPSEEHRQRTESGAFEYQAFESDMESEGGSATATSTRDAVASRSSSIKRTTRARPESGLLPLRLSADRPALGDRTNVVQKASTTPPRRAKTSNKFSPYHLSPPAPLRFASRKTRDRGTGSDDGAVPVPKPGKVFVDWDLENEFASLELAMDIGDEM